MASFTVAIVGGGFGGIDAAIQLRKRFPEASLALFEAADELGGVWQWNTYPGCACDIQSHLYSLSYELKPGLRSVPGEALTPLEKRLDRQLLESRRNQAVSAGRSAEVRSDRIFAVSEIVGPQFETLTWIESRNQWLLVSRTAGGGGGTVTEEHFDYVVSAQGPLHIPKIPDYDGIEKFEGDVFHTARWKSDFNAQGKVVAVIGTGASAVQAIPELAKTSKELVVFQRHAAWITTKADYKYSAVAKWVFRNVPLAARIWRYMIFWSHEYQYLAFRTDSRISRALRGLVQMQTAALLRAQVPDAQKRAVLTPHYPFGARRVTPSNQYLRAMAGATVVDGDPVVRFEPRAVVTASGRVVPVDAVVLATGFVLNGGNAGIMIRGRCGNRLADGFEASYRSTLFPKFPNIFFILGPNSGAGHTSVLIPLEMQNKYIANLISEARRLRMPFIEVTDEAAAKWDKYVQKGFEGTVWPLDNSSWYHQGGKILTLWPYSWVRFMREMRALPKMSDFLS
ncbi:hypothetical protein HDU83_001814 [Entophlyctis luteolus]|nr:hypothetical protein HDU83_001814 [Entophlyctis luteolus]